MPAAEAEALALMVAIPVRMPQRQMTWFAREVTSMVDVERTGGEGGSRANRQGDHARRWIP